MDEHGETLTLGDRVAWAGLFLVGLLCVARAMIEHDPFPWWSSDPFVFAPPITGLTPRWALLLNTGIVIASGLMILGQHLRGYGFSLLNAILIAIGLGVVGYHASTDLERTLDASTIAAAVAALAAASQAYSIPGAARVFGSVVLGFALMLTAVGIHEVYVSHPQTLAMYEQTRDSFLSARGWSEGSFEAMSYERRLRNPEPIAWFGLTNVFASFVAASGAALLTLGIACWSNHRLRSVVLLVASAISVFGLYLCGSKGGYAVFAIGAVLGIIAVTRERPRIDGRLVLTLCGLAIGALLLRGLIGESLGERSLLFRFQYLAGSINVWLADPLLGCGPGVFQERYALLKPPLSPEDVASPHSVLFDWIATLGVGGIALCVYLCRSVLRCGRAGDEASPGDGIGQDNQLKLATLLISLATIIALRIQLPVLSGAEITPIFAGLVLWGCLAIAVIRRSIDDRTIRLALLVVAGVLMVHAMIEVTATLIVSAPLWAFAVGLAVGTEREQHRGRAGARVLMVALAATGVLLLTQWPAMNRWERGLHGAADSASAISGVHNALNELEFSTTPDRDLVWIAEQLSGLTGMGVVGTVDSIIPALNQAEFVTRSDAIERLERSLRARPSHTPTRIAISQQMLWIASVRLGMGQQGEAERAWEQAIELFEGRELGAQGHRWLGSMWSGRVSAFPGHPERDRWLRNAMEQFKHAAEQTPHEPELAYQIMSLSLDLGDEAEARAWGERALTLHERMRLDPIRGLSEDELERVRSTVDP